MRFFFQIIAATAFLAVSVTAAGTYEWAGIFDTPLSSYVWTSQLSKKGTYVDPTMDMVFLDASAATQAALDALEPMGKSSLAKTCTVVAVGGTITPANNKCFRLQFNAKLHTSSFVVTGPPSKHMAIFAQHVPTEFERDRHYLQDSKGTDIEPAAELPKKKAAAHDDHKPWGAAIGASCAVLIVTLIGVMFAIPGFNYLLREYPDTIFTVTNAFAAGALLAAAFYLMLYEATHLIVRPKEAESTAYWGSAIILGYLVATIIELCVTAIYKHEHANSQPKTEEVEMGEPAKDVEAPADHAVVPETSESVDGKSRDCTRTCGSENGSGNGSGDGNGNGDGNGHEEKTSSDESMFGSLLPNENSIRILSSILIGDFVHNLVDGIVIGAAFLGCSSGVAWGITGATIGHEIAQEIADYLVLTSPDHGGLKPVLALLLNFLSGLSVVIGAIIVLAQDNVSNLSQGMLLAFGGGVYLQIGASECMPRVHNYAKTTGLRLGSLIAFIIGAVAIGLVLLDHEHCVPGAASGGGDAHGH